ncbi:MAG TPA: VanZ family protein [Gaiellaceae bacterium]|nr:VanZ family protein [Gaiellaceae bacterium]
MQASATLRLWAPVVLWAAVIFALSSVSDLGTGLGTWDLVLRKLAHAAEFALLGALLLRALGNARAAVALGVAYAVSDELHQHFVPGRLGSPIDVAIDSVGVGLGVVLWRSARFSAWTRRRCPTGSSRPCSNGSTGSRTSWRD